MKGMDVTSARICPGCQQAFAKTSELKRHLIQNKQNPSHWYKCDDCHQSFQSKPLLRLHVTQQHRGSFKEGRYRCLECGKSYAHLSSLLLHQTLHAPTPPMFVCHVCGRAFSTRRCLSNHVSQVHERVVKATCPICDKTFVDRTRLTFHMRIHSGARPESCKICHARFKQPSHLLVHLQTHNDTRDHQCRTCGACFRNKQCWRNHTRTHEGAVGKFVCEICRARFRLRVYLERHLVSHSETPQESCYCCNKVFKHRKNLLEHLKVHKGTALKCPVAGCQREFLNNRGLREHLYGHGMGEKTYECSWPRCGEKFYKKNHLDRHYKREHTQIAGYFEVVVE